MMQFIEISNILKASRTIQKIALVTVAFFEIVLGSTQLDIRLGSVSGEDEPGKGEYTGGVTIQEIYNGSYALSPTLELMLENSFDGLKSLYWDKTDEMKTRNYPLQEKLFPSSNIASAGLRWTGLGDFQVTLRNFLYLNSLPLNPYYLNFVDSMKIDESKYVFPISEMSRKARTYANVYWALPFGRATITADINFIILKYFRTVYAYDQESNYLPVDSSMLHDNDLWSEYSFSYRLFKDVYVKLDATLKQNLSGHNILNMYHYNIEFNGTHQFPQKNQITWIAGSELYQRSNRDYMSEDFLYNIDSIYPMALSPLFFIYLRDVFTISRGFFLKGTAIFEAGQDFLKQRYEISLRKAWKNLSYIEPGYNTSLGGLFPIQSLYVKSCFQATKSFGIIPAVKFSWEGPEGSGENVFPVTFIKMLSSLELSYAIKKRTEIILGGNYTYYNEDAGLPTRFGMYCGLRSIIP